MFVALVLSAALVIPGVAEAAVGKPFLHGVSSPADLATRIEASLEKNPKGTSMLDPARCKRDGSCASPIHYLQALQKVDPGAHLTNVAQVPEFLRTLQVIDAPAGKYWISCLKPTGGSYKVEIHCLERSFKVGEKAWVDKKSGVIVLASDCTNVVEKPVSPKQVCVEIHFTTKTGDTAVRFALLGPANVADDCIGVKKKGATEFERWWRDECPDEHCGFRAPAQVVGQQVRLIGSYVPEPGEHVLRLPAFVAEKASLYVTVLCLDRGLTVWPEFPKDGYTLAERNKYASQREQWITGHSDGIGIRWFEYLNTTTETKVATVYYTKAEGPTNAPYWPWGEWFRTHPEQLAR